MKFKIIIVYPHDWFGSGELGMWGMPKCCLGADLWFHTILCVSVATQVTAPDVRVT